MAAEHAVERLRAHNVEFEKDIIRLHERVVVAVGYSGSNVSMLIGDDGVVIIDTTESTAAATNILAEFRKITDLPVKTIIYTHSHRDHIGGASVFAEGGSPEVISRANLSLDIMDDGSDRPNPKRAILARTKRQFGMGLADKTERVSIGVGPSDRPIKGLGAGFLAPTHTFEGDLHEVSLCGFDLALHAAPGETDDHLVVWWDEQKILFSGDNYYKAFPNLYAIRGTRYRDFGVWADTLDQLAAFNAEQLVPGHTRPLTGVNTIREHLLDYGAAIRSVIAQTVDAMNRGETPLEFIEHIALPPELADKPFLQEFYGCVTWSARAYFEGEMGWFDGNPTSLFPTPRRDKAERLTALAGGADAVLAALKAAQQSGDHQWACELADTLLDLQYETDTVKALKADSLVVMADDTVNACARNYYLVYAAELRAGDV